MKNKKDKSLSDKILEENIWYIGSKNYDSDIKNELIRLYLKWDWKGVLMLAKSLYFVYNHFFNGYEDYLEAFDSSRLDLESFAEDADELMGFQDTKKIAVFYRESVGYSGYGYFFKNFSSN
jgi:hypothetical protein